MSCAEFVRWAESDSAHQCYVSWDFPGPDDIPNDGLDRLAEDIPSLAEFAINETDSGTPNSAVWMGARGVVAQSHYDIQHNIFAQLRGEKTFVVAPPSEALAYRLFPEAHVRSRQSQLPRRCRRRRRRCARPTSDRATCCICRRSGCTA